MNVAIYLRKSRHDRDAGEEETLSNHKKVLLELAKERKYLVKKIFQEVVSGESIALRPQMQALLDEVKSYQYDAVLCMDIDRLGRGNMQDQGLILDIFKTTKTKIITPRKIYDLDDEIDEEFSEFEAFMARKEFKIIKRRLQAGRIRSIKDGNFISNRPPYGYRKVSDGKSTFLEIDEDQAKIVQLIFNMYTKERIGGTKIASRLNEMGIPSYTGGKWISSVILHMLTNPIYIGKIRWGFINRRPSLAPDKKMECRRRKEDEIILADGKHPPIIDIDTWNQAQEIRTKKVIPKLKKNFSLTNPFAGLLTCGKCGRHMSITRKSRKKTKNPETRIKYAVCNSRASGVFCGNKLTRLDYIEEKVLEEIKKRLADFELQINADDYITENHKLQLLEIKMKNTEKEIQDLMAQLDRIYNNFERGLYSDELFLERQEKVKKELDKARERLKLTKEEYIKEEGHQRPMESIPILRHVLDVYHHLSIRGKNLLMKQIIEKIIYTKEKHQKNDDFTLDIMFKI
ncbi:recombinase family protein [Thermoactinomyces sp. CICC 10521]|uniref:recombinase family protein n=1 Tax=Thermoactinomyces sp. CICC 10521 TaxID=2767426 RepID=UPI0018DE4426|nr:recombinase family protein [Thermoactinomyces sp. CICC 10521]MBH8609093.1 recombinase family protein [Thermoactinomyces sp. CICC 10521]